MEIILCAAIWYPNIENLNPHNCINIENGTVLCGFRHGHIMSTFSALTQSKTPLHKHVQGFLTSKNRFLNRIEAHELFVKNGGKPSFNDELYSEDLY